MNDLEEIVYKHALLNAAKNKGSANPGAVIGSIMSQEPDLRSRAKEIGPIAGKIVAQVNKLSEDEQSAQMAKYHVEVKENKKKKMQSEGGAVSGGCPGSRARELDRQETQQPEHAMEAVPSRLRQWPVQIKLAPVNAPYFDGASLLVAADCTAYAYGNFHQDFIRGKVTLIGCPKLDSVDYSEKLTEIIRQNDIRSLTIVRMEVPCCGGIEHAAVTALKNSGKFIPWQVVTISTAGRILEK